MTNDKKLVNQSTEVNQGEQINLAQIWSACRRTIFAPDLIFPTKTFARR